MSLQDFLGKTVEIRIIDFLAENRAFSYNQTEISKCLGVSRTSVNQKLPELIFNGIVDVKETHGNVNSYQLANNGIVKKLISSVFENGFLVSNYGEDENIVISQKKEIVGSISYSDGCRYYCGSGLVGNGITPRSYKLSSFQKPKVVYQESGDNSVPKRSWDDILLPTPASA
ncbi:MAG: hypothetical protein RBT65_11865 [Methanolobus sp.]|nr:hypothetical protein [Methanolobus sp.]